MKFNETQFIHLQYFMYTDEQNDNAGSIKGMWHKPKETPSINQFPDTKQIKQTMNNTL
jgi:hypothetical protein